MNLIEKLQAAADKNGDGTLSTGDLSSLVDNAPAPLQDSLQQLKDHADQSGDGKVDMADAENVLGGAGGFIGETIQKLFGK